MEIAKIWGRGQLTIPSQLREELELRENTAVYITKVGQSLLLTAANLPGDRLAQRVEEEMQKQELSLDDLLEDLKKQRQRYNRENYGR